MANTENSHYVVVADAEAELGRLDVLEGLNVAFAGVQIAGQRVEDTEGGGLIDDAELRLGRTLGMSAGRTRESVRRLDELGALHVLERGKTGHLAEMRLPKNIRAIRSGGMARLLTGEPLGPLKRVPGRNSKPGTSGKPGCSVKPFTIANAALASTACGGLSRMCGASTTSCRGSATGAIPTGTWCPAVSSAIRPNATVARRIFCAFFTVRGDSRRRNATAAWAPCGTWRRGRCGPLGSDTAMAR